MTAVVKGRIKWGLDRDNDGHRDYTVSWLVWSPWNTGPTQILSAIGLPAIGSWWIYGGDNDPWAFCSPRVRVTQYVNNQEPEEYWIVEQYFSTRPGRRCQDVSIENPLEEPPDVRGSFVKMVREATIDRSGKPIKNSSHEMIRGTMVEKDESRPTVNITTNVLNLNLPLLTRLKDTLNDAPLWGVDDLCIKHGAPTWERQLYGLCNFYYRLEMNFEIDFDGWDRKTWDEGTKVLAEGGDPDDPNDFILYTDLQGNPTRVFLNGAGEAIVEGEDPAEIDLELYNVDNLLLLPIPTGF